MKVNLRAVEPEDLELMYRLENDQSIWLQGDTRAPYSRYALKRYIENNTSNLYTDQQLRLVIEMDGKGVGFLDLFDFQPDHQRAQVGIALLAEYRGVGVAKASIIQIIEYARNILHLHQLVAVVRADNSPSLRLFGSTGFQHTSTLPQWFRERDGWVDACLFQLYL